jgi:hypothetical protein
VEACPREKRNKWAFSGQDVFKLMVLLNDVARRRKRFSIEDGTLLIFDLEHLNLQPSDPVV